MPNLNGLQEDIHRIALDLSSKIDHLQSMVSNRDGPDEIGAMRNLRNCVQTAATIVTSTSTIIASEQGDQMSVIHGSDFGDCFPSETSEIMRRWMSSNTVHEFEASEDPDPDPGQASSRHIQASKNLDDGMDPYNSESDSNLEDDMVNALFKSGMNSLNRENYDLAERQFRNCLSRVSASTITGHQRAKASNCVSMFDITTGLCELYLQQERLEDATSILKNRLSEGRRSFGKGDQGVLSDMVVLAEVLRQKGDGVEAQLYARKALKGYRRLGVRGTDGIRTTLTLLVQICHADGKDDEGDAYAAMLSDFMERQPSSDNHDKVPEVERKEKALPSVSATESSQYIFNVVSGVIQARHERMLQQEVERPEGIMRDESSKRERKLERDKEKDEEDKMIRYLQRNVFDQPSHVRSRKKTTSAPTDAATSASVSRLKPATKSTSSTLGHPSVQIVANEETPTEPTSTLMLSTRLTEAIPSEPSITAKDVDDTESQTINTTRLMQQLLPVRRTRNEQYVWRHLIIFGDTVCGKTCLVLRYARGVFPEFYEPTVHEDLVHEVPFWSTWVRLAIVDTPRLEDYRYWRTVSDLHFHVVLIAFDISDPHSLNNVLEKWIGEVSRLCQGVPIILVGCKKDLRHDSERLAYLAKMNKHPVTTEEAEEVRAKIGASRYFECSAKTNEGVSELFEYAAVLEAKNTKRRRFHHLFSR